MKQGDVFGRLTLVRRISSGTRTNPAWLCECTCGRMAAVYADSLKSRNTSSCGCLRREMTGAKLRRHSMSETAIYRVWANMKTRCFNKNVAKYKDYGGRGITVCERWMTFDNFYADMGDVPPGMTIERKNNNGNYEPSNCVWATPQQQALNRRPRNGTNMVLGL